MEHTDICSKEISNGNLKVERAFFPSLNKVTPIPEYATARVFLPDCRTFASIKLARKVLPLPPGASKKIVDHIQL